MYPGAGSFDQLHAMDYLVYAYLQQARDTSARRVLDEMAAMTKVDQQQVQGAHALAIENPSRHALLELPGKDTVLLGQLGPPPIH